MPFTRKTLEPASLHVTREKCSPLFVVLNFHTMILHATNKLKAPESLHVTREKCGPLFVVLNFHTMILRATNKLKAPYFNELTVFLLSFPIRKRKRIITTA
jgi:hypothetical protein